jgi:CRISPR system Cascade subunit CasE
MQQPDLFSSTQPPTVPAGELYLSRLTLNLRSREVQADLANSQKLHGRLLTAFPATGNRADFTILYRIEPSASEGTRAETLTGLVQSAILPDWSNLPDHYLANVPLNWFDQASSTNPTAMKRIDRVYQAISSGHLLRFRLRANPTRKIHIKPDDPRGGRQTGKNGMRVPVREEELPNWLARKGSQHGFRIVESRHQPDPISGSEQRGSKSTSHGGDSSNTHDRQRLIHQAVVFDGVLEVIDAARFQETLRSGIGSAKAYGFGLLSVAGYGGH